MVVVIHNSVVSWKFAVFLLPWPPIIDGRLVLLLRFQKVVTSFGFSQ